MTDENFGDFDIDDAWADEPADPEQVAMRLHELRIYLEEAAGDDLAAWDALSEGERAVCITIGTRLIASAKDNPDSVPQDVHEAVIFFSQQPEWADLDDASRAVGVALMDDILMWFARQGSVLLPDGD